MATKYPQMIYIYCEAEGTRNECLLAYEKPEDINDALREKRIVGVYELKKVVEVSAEVKISQLPVKRRRR